MCHTYGKNHKTKYGLNLSIKSKHQGSFKHQCSLCNKTFNQTVQYRYHCSKHLNVQIYKCTYCKMTFSSHGSLERHMKTCVGNKRILLKSTNAINAMPHFPPSTDLSITSKESMEGSATHARDVTRDFHVEPFWEWRTKV